MAISASVGSGGGAGSLECDREATLRVYTNLFVYKRNNSYDRSRPCRRRRRGRAKAVTGCQSAARSKGGRGYAVPTNNAVYRILNSCDAPRDSPTVGLAGGRGEIGRASCRERG